MCPESVQVRAGRWVPQVDDEVVSCGGQQLTRGAERSRPQPPGMQSQLVQGISGLNVPHSGGPVPRGARKDAVGEVDGIDPVVVTLQCPNECPRCGIPQPDLAVVTSGCDH